MKIITILLIFFLFTLNCKKEKIDHEFKTKIKHSPTEMTIKAKGGLRLRDFPGISGNIIIVIPDGSKVKIFQYASDTEKHDGVYGRWRKVVYNQYSGFVFSGFLVYENMSPYEEVPYVFSSEVESKIKNLFDYSLVDEIDFSKESRLPELEDSKLENLEEFFINGYRIITISPNKEDCSFFGGANCINIIEKDRKYLTSDLNRKSFGKLLEIKNDNIEFLIEAGCGTTCDFSYNSTKYILNTKTNSFYREEEYISENHCINELSEYEPECKLCTQDFKSERFTTTITHELSYEGKIIKSDRKSEVIKE